MLKFSSYLFAAARHESFKVMKRRGGAELVEDAPEQAAARAPPPPLDTDPERSALLESSQGEVRAANSRLPLRHREVLALRELEGCTYDEIAEILGSNRNSVSQLIWRARAKLRDEMRVGALHSVAATTADCERAQALISLDEDGELDEVDRAWLERHLKECGNCRTSRAALLEVGASYRAWLPIAALAGMRNHVLSRGGEVVGADWSATAGSSPAGGSPGGVAGIAPYAGVAALTAVLLALGLTLALSGGSEHARPAARTPAQKPPSSEIRAAQPSSPRATEAPRRHARPPKLRLAARRGAATGLRAAPDRPPAARRQRPLAAPDADTARPVPAAAPRPTAPSACAQLNNHGRGPPGCPPGHGGEPLGRKGAGGRGPPGGGGPPGHSFHHH